MKTSFLFHNIGRGRFDNSLWRREGVPEMTHNTHKQETIEYLRSDCLIKRNYIYLFKCDEALNIIKTESKIYFTIYCNLPMKYCENIFFKKAALFIMTSSETKKKAIFNLFRVNTN